MPETPELSIAATAKLLKKSQNNPSASVQSNINVKKMSTTNQTSRQTGDPRQNMIIESSGWWTTSSIKYELFKGDSTKEIAWKVFEVSLHFWLSNPLTHAWRNANIRSVFRTIKHPQKVHVYGAYCSKGFGKLTVFSGNLNSVRICELYKSTL